MHALRLVVEADAWPALEALLDELGALAVTQSNGDRDRFDEPGHAGAAEWQRFEVEALFDDAITADLAARAIEAALPGSAPRTAAVAGEDWNEAWKRGWQAQHFAGGLCVVPGWLEPPADARHVVRVDPGQAFGTGTHVTTALCLDWLGRHPPAGLTVLDYGCGSAVLAIAAARLGAAAVTAIDIDPQAVRVAAENVGLNGVDTVVEVGLPPAVLAPADVVVANILLEPLVALAPRLTGALRAGGRIALAGILAEQVPSLTDAYGDALRFDPVTERDGWALVTGRLG
ncbi:MAG: 50S ribosomal protein L11 methyltransferase [Gammaproteobacteria bacterium]